MLHVCCIWDVEFDIWDDVFGIWDDIFDIFQKKKYNGNGICYLRLCIWCFEWWTWSLVFRSSYLMIEKSDRVAVGVVVVVKVAVIQ